METGSRLVLNAFLAGGRVVAAGGNPHGGHQVAWKPPDPDEELRLEVYSPPYLFRGTRPVIKEAPAELAYGQKLTIRWEGSGAIRWASLVRPGITTHAFDSSQRLVDLQIDALGDGAISVTVTDQPNLAPPGRYMLFLTDDRGVPSVAAWVRLA